MTWRDRRRLGLTEMARENRGSFNLVVDPGPPVREIIVPRRSGVLHAGRRRERAAAPARSASAYEAVGHRRQPFTQDDVEGPITISRPHVRP